MTITIDSVREAARLADKLEALDDVLRNVESMKHGLVLIRFIPLGNKTNTLGDINSSIIEATLLIRSLVKQTEEALREIGVDPDSTEGAGNV